MGQIQPQQQPTLLKGTTQSSLQQSSPAQAGMDSISQMKAVTPQAGMDSISRVIAATGIQPSLSNLSGLQQAGMPSLQQAANSLQQAANSSFLNPSYLNNLISN